MKFDANGIKDMLLLLAGLMVVGVGAYAAVLAKNKQIRDGLGVLVGILIAAFIIALGSRLEEVGNFLFGIIF